MRDLRSADIEWTVEALPEDALIQGNASAIDPETDRETEQWITEQLESGNEWAWCTVKVTGRFRGLSAHAYLGCCSYESREAITMPEGYYPDLQAEILEEINKMRRAVCADSVR